MVKALLALVVSLQQEVQTVPHAAFLQTVMVVLEVVVEGVLVVEEEVAMEVEML